MNKIYNIDYVRFILAYLVLFQHSFELGAFNYPLFHTFFGSKFAVDCFFILSGFLVFQSFDKDPKIYNYFIKRFFRIYPAYIFTILFFILLFIILFKQINYQSLLNYLLSQLFFTNSIHPTIQGVFQNNHFNVINGALWTLKIEILFYISVPIIYLISKKIGLLRIVFVLFLSSLSWDYTMLYLSKSFNIPDSLFHQFPTQLKYFSSGIFLYYLFESKSIKTTSLLHLVLSFLLYLLIYKYSFEENFILRPLILSSILFSVITLKYQLPKLTFDFSYGLYISHFPILQLLLTFNTFSHIKLFIISSSLVIVYACMVWNFIEKPFMKYGKNMIRINNIK